MIFKVSIPSAVHRTFLVLFVLACPGVRDGCSEERPYRSSKLYSYDPQAGHLDGQSVIQIVRNIQGPERKETGLGALDSSASGKN
jgi:hypothetical protein